MSGDRRKYVMPVELAMQREMEYRKRLDLSQLKHSTESWNHPPPRNQTPLPASYCDPRPTSGAGTSRTLSPRPKLSSHPSSTSTEKPSPSSHPSPSPRLTPQPRPKSVLGPSPLHQPRDPSLPLKRMSQSQGPTSGPRLMTRPSFSSGSNQVIRGLESTLCSMPKAVPVRPSPHPHMVKGTGSLTRPKLSSLGLSASPKQSLTPNLQSRPFQAPIIDPILRLGPGPSHKRKEAPEDLQLDHNIGNKVSKLVCKVCNVMCTSPGNLEMHLKGQKHRAKVMNGSLTGKGKDSEKIEVNDPRLCCELCNVWCMNEFSLKQHLSGRNHIYKLHAAQKM